MAASSSKSDGVAGGGAGAAIVGAVIVCLIYFGRDVLIPIALAILLSFVLAPIVRTLQEWHVPRGLSTIAVVLLAFLALFAVGGIVAMQVTQLAADLPRYQSTIHAKIESLRARSVTSGPLERAAEMLEDFGREINRPADGQLQRPMARSGQETKPVPVEVRQPPAGPLEGLSTWSSYFFSERISAIGSSNWLEPAICIKQRPPLTMRDGALAASF